MRSAAALLLLPAAFLALFYALPLARTLGAVSEDAWRWLLSPYVLGRLRVALLQAVLSVALTLALALPLAYVHHRYQLPWSRAHLALHAAPFVLPVFVVVFGVQSVLGDALSWAGPLVAVVVAHAYYNYGFAARLLHATLERRPARLEDAARTLGAPALAAFARVSLPLLLPSMLAVALLVFIFSFSSFGVVLLLGEGRVSTLETMLYQSLGGAFPRPDRAAALGLSQLALNLALLVAYAWLFSRDVGLERASAPRRQRAGPAMRAFSWASLALALAPALAVLAGAFRVRGEWTLEAWRALLDASHPAHLAGFHLGTVLALSLLYAASAIVLALALTLLLAYGARRLRWGRRVVEALATLPLGTSSLLLGLGFVLAFGAGSLLDLRGSPALIVAAHGLVAFPFVARVVLPALALHDARLDEAAALLGARPLDVVRRVHVPLLAAPLAAAAGFAAAMSLGDFGASLLLMRPDNMALSVWIHRHDVAFDPVRKAEARALAALLMALVATTYLAVERAVARTEAR